MHSNRPIFSDFVGAQQSKASYVRFDLVSPQDSQVIGQIAESGAAGVDRAVKAAASAFAAHRKQPTHQRT